MPQKKKFVVLSGAGVSAESGLKTFRDSDGLWEGYRIEDVATPEAWYRNPEMVLDFYNQRRRAGVTAKPNIAHELIASLENKFDVVVITQNVDNLHERAGSKNVLHLHGEIFKSRSTADPNLVYDIEGSELVLGDCCEKGSQLRPHIVWFGESVPMMDVAVGEVEDADYFLVIGTSLLVYPAASLVDFVPSKAKKFLIDPKVPSFSSSTGFQSIAKPATSGMQELLKMI